MFHSHLADAYSHLRAAEALIYQACWLYENGKPCGAEANMAKLRASEAGFKQWMLHFKRSEDMAMPKSIISNEFIEWLDYQELLQLQMN